MILGKEKIKTLYNTPMGIKVYSARHELPHIHEEYLEAVICLKGTAQITIAYESFDLEPGDIIVVDSLDVHCISSTDKNNLIASFHIDQTHELFGDPGLVNMAFVCHRGEVHPTMEPEIEAIKAKLLSALYAYISNSYNKNSKASILEQTSKQVMNSMQENFSIFYWMNDPSRFEDGAKTRFEDIYRYIFQNTKEKITIAELGEREHVNPNYLSQFLRKTSFFGLRGLRTYTRVYKAETMLLATDMQMPEISDACGFSDPKYFYRSFKQYYHRTPLQHRKYYEEYIKQTEENVQMDTNELKQLLTLHIADILSSTTLSIYDIKA